MYKRILVATDGSELSAKAVDSSINLAKALGAELFALKVTYLRSEDHWDGALIHDRDGHARLEAQMTNSAQSVVDAVKASAQAAGVQATALTVKSPSVAETVIEVSKKYDCDLVVMASHGRRGLSRVLLGSETQHVLTHSLVPVLVLR